MSRMLIVVLAVVCVCGACERLETPDNAELAALVDADQRDRIEGMDEPIAPRDNERRKRVFEMLSRGEVVTPADKFHAAIILQHTGMIYIEDQLRSMSEENHYLAYQLALAAFEGGHEEARYLVAATYDRYSWMAYGYQKFGTQTTYVNDEEMWVTIDSATTDVERAKYNVPPLRELLKQKPMQ